MKYVMQSPTSDRFRTGSIVVQKSCRDDDRDSNAWIRAAEGRFGFSVDHDEMRARRLG